MFGISLEYNEYTPDHPWYGASQGAGDMTIRWAVLSHSLITAYKSQATLWPLSNPTHQINITQGINAFCNDTSLVDATTPDNPRTTLELLQTTQTNLNLWNDLLEASGGALNPTKCTWAHFHWSTKNDLLSLQCRNNDSPNQQITLSRLGNQPKPLQQLQPHQSYRYLGVHITMNGDWRKELQVLNERNIKYLQVLTKCHLTRREVKVIYRQCYLPAVTYPLPASVIPPGKLHDAQSSTTTAFLSKMGYARTFPRAVVYAPKTRGGLGFCHLSAEQGVQKALQVLKHLRADTTTGKVYQTLINHYQLNAGFSTPILEHTIAAPWSTAYWIDTLREYLNQTGGQIILQNAWTPKPRRSHDQAIMEALLEANLKLSPHELKIINNVRIGLQATMLSDIVNAAGTHIRKECLKPTPILPNRQDLLNPNRSMLRWPQHASPSPSNWWLWSKTLRQLFSTSNTTKLTQPLGRWNANYNKDYEWNWRVCPTTYHLYHLQNQQWFVYKPSTLR